MFRARGNKPAKKSDKYEDCDVRVSKVVLWVCVHVSRVTMTFDRSTVEFGASERRMARKGGGGRESELAVYDGALAGCEWKIVGHGGRARVGLGGAARMRSSSSSSESISSPSSSDSSSNGSGGGGSGLSISSGFSSRM